MRRRLAALAALMTLAACATGGGADRGRGAEPTLAMQSRLDELVSAHPHFSGSVLVARDGVIVAEAHRGMADQAHARSNDADTLHCIASVGKMFTAVAAAQLNERGLLAFETPVAELLPELSGRFAPSVTVDDLLHHTSGVRWMSEISDAELDATRSNHDFFALMLATDMATSGPAPFAYRNPNYILLGEIIERLTGAPYEDYIRENISRPLSMRGPVFARPDEIDDAPVARPYMHVDYETWWSSEDEIPVDETSAFIFEAPAATPSAGGGAYATVGDMFAFARALRGADLISADSWRAMCDADVRDRPDRPSRYGRGCSSLVREGELRVGHTGSTAGVQARFFLYEESGFDVIVLSNHEGQAAPLFSDIEAQMAQHAP